MIGSYPCPLPGGGFAEEYATCFDRGRTLRLLIVPALFDEGNRMRRLTVEVMRRLDASGIDCLLPDLPGTNESPQSLELQTVASWRAAMAAAERQFRPSNVLGIRGGALFVPSGKACWHYAATKGASILRTMLRSRIVTSREAGREETQDGLLAQAVDQGIELAGYRLGAEFVRQFRELAPDGGDTVSPIEQDLVGGGGLWLRAEPDEDRHQADALAAILAVGMKA